MIKTTRPVELKPFQTPNFVRTARDDGNESGIPISALDPDALSALCDQFRADVFAKAKLKDPRS